MNSGKPGRGITLPEVLSHSEKLECLKTKSNREKLLPKAGTSGFFKDPEVWVEKEYFVFSECQLAGQRY